MSDYSMTPTMAQYSELFDQVRKLKNRQKKYQASLLNLQKGMCNLKHYVSIQRPSRSANQKAAWIKKVQRVNNLYGKLKYMPPYKFRLQSGEMGYLYYFNHRERCLLRKMLKRRYFIKNTSHRGKNG